MDKQNKTHKYREENTWLSEGRGLDKMDEGG